MAGVDQHDRTARQPRLATRTSSTALGQLQRQAATALRRSAPIASPTALSGSFARRRSASSPTAASAAAQWQARSCPPPLHARRLRPNAPSPSSALGADFDGRSGCGAAGAMLTGIVHPSFRKDAAASIQDSRHSRLTLHDATGRPLPCSRQERGGASFATRIARQHGAAEAFPNIAPSPLRRLAQSIARRRPATAGLRARRIFNVHAHANRRAPPGGDPGRRRQGKPDRGI